MNDAGARILVVDDEPAIQRFLYTALTAEGYSVFKATTGGEALAQVTTHRPDMIILDLGLPDMDGSQVTRRVREWSSVPIIILSVRGQETDKIDALDAGADDYLTKPFSVGELLARLRVAQRHSQPAPEAAIFQAGSLKVDLVRRVVTVRDEPIKLTATEYAFLRLLVQNAGKVLTHRQILREVWGPQYVDETHYLRVYAAQLRRKIEDDPAQPKLLLTEPGVGYRFTPGEWVTNTEV